MRTWLIVGVVLLTGCSSTNPGVGHSEPPGPGVSPTPDIPALAKQYQAAADKSNKAQDAIAARMTAGTITKSQEFALVADTDHQFVADLHAIVWPAAFRADERDLEKAVAVDEQVLRNLAAAKSSLEQAALVSQFTAAKNEEGAATTRLRLDLGLPAAS